MLWCFSLIYQNNCKTRDLRDYTALSYYSWKTEFCPLANLNIVIKIHSGHFLGYCMMCQELAYTKIVICMQFLELLKTENI